MTAGGVVLAVVLAFIVGKWYGWAEAHRTVATECERLGKFYVGKKVYSCIKIEEKE